jgi:multidrug efflux pump subunit AcrA (membrane-fusion protein)
VVGNLQLKSNRSGVVYEIYRRPGDLVAQGQAVALIGSGRLIAKLLVDEEDLSKVYKGQKAVLSIDAFPGKVFNATVERIYPILNRAEQSFRVDAVLNDPLPQAIYGLNVEANIIINEKKQVTVIPATAVGKGDSVVVKQGGKIAKVKITKGVEDDNWVEVKGGLPHHSLLMIQR